MTVISSLSLELCHSRHHITALPMHSHRVAVSPTASPSLSRLHLTSPRATHTVLPGNVHDASYRQPQLQPPLSTPTYPYWHHAEMMPLAFHRITLIPALSERSRRPTRPLSVPPHHCSHATTMPCQLMLSRQSTPAPGSPSPLLLINGHPELPLHPPCRSPPLPLFHQAQPRRRALPLLRPLSCHHTTTTLVSS